MLSSWTLLELSCVHLSFRGRRNRINLFRFSLLVTANDSLLLDGRLTLLGDRRMIGGSGKHSTGCWPTTAGQFRRQLLLVLEELLLLLLLKLSRVLLRVLPVVNRKSIGLQWVGVLLRNINLDALIVLQHAA